LSRYRFIEAFERRPLLVFPTGGIITYIFFNDDVSRFLTGLGLFCNISASLALFYFSDKFSRHYTNITANSRRDFEEKAIAQHLLAEKKADPIIRWILGYLIIGFILQLVGLWIDP
jgi:hypothetical protein